MLAITVDADRDDHRDRDDAPVLAQSLRRWRRSTVALDRVGQAGLRRRQQIRA
jgi:hypothetical protein